MLYRMYMLGFYLMNSLPVKVSYFISNIVARIFYVFSRRDIKELRDNLEIVLGERTGKNIIRKHIYSIFINFGKYLVDFFRFYKMTKKDIFRNIEIKNIEYIDETLAEGKGLIITSLHIGNWELGGAVVAALGYPISAFVLKHADERIDRFFVKQRDINGMASIPLGASVKSGFRALKRNEILVIVGDKDYTGGGVPIDFFGKKAILPKGPAVFSLKAGSPILVAVLVREKGDKFKLEFMKPQKYELTGNFDNDVKITMRSYVDIFEKYIRSYPDQWYVFRRIWEREAIIQ